MTIFRGLIKESVRRYFILSKSIFLSIRKDIKSLLKLLLETAKPSLSIILEILLDDLSTINEDKILGDM
jgi:hypothetical protein